MSASLIIKQVRFAPTYAAYDFDSGTAEIIKISVDTQDVFSLSEIAYFLRFYVYTYLIPTTRKFCELSDSTDIFIALSNGKFELETVSAFQNPQAVQVIISKWDRWLDEARMSAHLGFAALQKEVVTKTTVISNIIARFLVSRSKTVTLLQVDLDFRAVIEAS